MKNRSHQEQTREAGSLLVFDRDRFIEQVLGNTQAAKQIAVRAIQDIQRNHLGIVDALEQSDAEQLHFHAHALKGVSHLLQCRELANCALKIDELAKNQMLQEAQSLATTLPTLIQAATEALDVFCQSE